MCWGCQSCIVGNVVYITLRKKTKTRLPAFKANIGDNHVSSQVIHGLIFLKTTVRNVLFLFGQVLFCE